MYVVLDTNLVVGYYLPRALNHKRARARARMLIDSIRTGQSRHFLYIPNIVIAETFSIFAKYSFGKNNRQVIKNGGAIDTRVYQSLCSQFKKDIHNGRVFYQLELNRYHVLGIDLVAPIDHYFKIQKKNKRFHPAGTFDQLIVSMGIHLSHVHGVNNVVLATADTRLTQLVRKCRSDIPSQTVQRLKLDKANDVAGKSFSQELFPEATHLGNARISDLRRIFTKWPLSIGNLEGRYTYDY